MTRFFVQNKRQAIQLTFRQTRQWTGILLLGLLFSQNLAAANSPGDDAYQNQELPAKEFKESDWKEATSGIDYSDDMQPRPPEKTTEPTDPKDEAAAKQFLKVIFIVGGILLLGVLLYFVVKSGFFIPKSAPKQKKATVKSVEEVEEDLENTDPSDFLHQAIANGQYELALRLYYLSIIRELSARKIISWKKDKTNRDYLHEARDSTLHEPFQRFTRIFEYIWYGEQAFSQTEFNRLQPQLEQFLQTIKKR